MRKLLAIIKREYVQRVRSRMFLVATILGPLVMFGFTVVPALIFQLNAGGTQRVAIVDETGRLYERVRAAILRDDDEAKADDKQTVARTSEKMRNNNLPARAGGEPAYVLEQVAPAGRALEDVQRELNERVRRNELDAYIILPRDINETGKAEYYARNLGDEDVVRRLQSRVSEAVGDERLAARGIDPQLVRASAQQVELTPQKAGAAGAATDGRGSFGLAFGIGFLIYLTTLLYGQVVLGAVVEEKTTRLTEMLFSSVDTFKLMIGKLLGVSLVALTQFSIWALAFLLLTLYGASATGSSFHLPQIAPSVVAYACLFFMLGYFLYATIYLLIGAMVTTTQEGGQLSMPIVFMLVASLWMAVPVIRSPNSPLAVWLSLLPFSAPITMMARIVTEPPPAWQ
ncbi:MAG TPA: ABC transporter permease, partial [Pyrinomonadaceae bacterium]|nr:ABC transporter permease [Pyrinomonadaceae bacterium]